MPRPVSIAFRTFFENFRRCVQSVYARSVEDEFVHSVVAVDIRKGLCYYVIMFDGMFAKYGRAVSDTCERKRLYGLFMRYIRAVASMLVFLFAIACETAIFHCIGPSDVLFAASCISILGVAISIVAAFWCHVKFKQEYCRILFRDPRPEEAPEVVAYRKKTREAMCGDTKSPGWAVALIVLGVVYMLVTLIVEAVNNPETDEFGALAISGIVVLCGCVSVYVFALLCRRLKQSANGELYEMSVEAEAKAIDAAQGRTHKYNVNADKNLSTLKYIMPDDELRIAADKIKNTYVKALFGSVIVFVVVAVVAGIILHAYGFSGYVAPVSMVIVELGTSLSVLHCTLGLSAIEKRQRIKLAEYPEFYADWLELYGVYDRYNRRERRIGWALLAAVQIIGFGLAIPFPQRPVSYVSFIGLFVWLFVNYKFTTALRTKLLPIEARIDAPVSVVFKAEYVDVEPCAKTECSCDGLECVGDFSLSIDGSELELMCDSATGRVLAISGKLPIGGDEKANLAAIDRTKCGAVYAVGMGALPSGASRTIELVGVICDAESKWLQLGTFDADENISISENVIVSIDKNKLVGISFAGQGLCVRNSEYK